VNVRNVSVHQFLKWHLNPQKKAEKNRTEIYDVGQDSKKSHFSLSSHSTTNVAFPHEKNPSSIQRKCMELAICCFRYENRMLWWM